jgi:hypothetical protein
MPNMMLAEEEEREMRTNFYKNSAVATTLFFPLQTPSSVSENISHKEALD